MNLIRALRTKPFRPTLSNSAHQHQNVALERDLKQAKQANMRKSSSGRAASRVSKGSSSARSSSRRSGNILPGDDDISETASQVSTPRPRAVAKCERSTPFSTTIAQRSYFKRSRSQQHVGKCRSTAISCNSITSSSWQENPYDCM